MYEFALARIEELLPVTPDCAPEENRNAAELEIVSSIVEEYEYIHYPIGSEAYEEPDLMEITKTFMTWLRNAEKNFFLLFHIVILKQNLKRPS